MKGPYPMTRSALEDAAATWDCSIAQAARRTRKLNEFSNRQADALLALRGRIEEEYGCKESKLRNFVISPSSGEVRDRWNLVAVFRLRGDVVTVADHYMAQEEIYANVG